MQLLESILFTPTYGALLHTIFEMLGTFLGLRLYWKITKNYPNTLSETQRYGVLFFAILGVFLGAHIVASAENVALFFSPASSWYYYLFTGGKTIIGGIAGGVIFVEMGKKLLKIKEKTGDNFVYPLILAIILGRIGCFALGVHDGTVGKVSNFILAFPQGDGLPRHPTSLYEIAFLIILYFILKGKEKYIYKKYSQGYLFRLFIIFYFTFRFFIEFIKPVDNFALGLSIIQIVCAIFVIYYIAKRLVSTNEPFRS